MKNLKIIIVDGSEQFRAGLNFFLESECGHEIIGEASTSNEFQKLENISNADVVLMDLFLSDKSSYDLAFEAIEKNRNLKIIALTSHVESVSVVKILESGFKACIFKENIFDSICNAISKVMRNEYSISDGIAI